jgi:dihydroflavonol-4-reductase
VVDLVTGGAGFIGRHVVDHLVRDGRRVRVLDLAPGSTFRGDVEVIAGSINDAPLLDRAASGAENVFHIAGNPQLWAPRAGDFMAANVEGTRSVLRAAARQGAARVVVTSTAAIHFKVPGRSENAEPTLADMPGAYWRSKFLAEKAALEAASEGVPVVILDPCLPIGAGDRGLSPPTRMILDFLNGRTKAYLDWELRAIHVDDLARAYLLAADRGAVGERYFLGGDPVPLSQMLRVLERLSGIAMPKRKVPYALAYLAGAVSEFIADRITHRPPMAPLAGVRITRHPANAKGLRTAFDLGLQLRSLEEALGDAIRWLDQNGYLERRLANPITAHAP